MTSMKISEVLFGPHFDENMGWQSYPVGRGYFATTSKESMIKQIMYQMETT